MRDTKSPVDSIDPKEDEVDPRFVLTADIEASIDLSQETEEETMPETLLHAHFKAALGNHQTGHETRS